MLIRDMLDPKTLRDREVPPVDAAGRPENHVIDQLLRTPLTELAGVRHPVVQTGMGWVAGPASSSVRRTQAASASSPAPR